MEENIFRFANVRPPQRKEAIEGSGTAIDPYGEGKYNTHLRSLLDRALIGSGLEQARADADSYLQENGIVTHLRDIAPQLDAFDRRIASLGLYPRPDSVIEAIRNTFDLTPEDLVQQDFFGSMRQKLADNITAAYFSNTTPLPRQSHLVRGIRLLELIERIALADETIFADGGVSHLLQMPVMIPFELEAFLEETDLSPSMLVPFYRLVHTTSGDHFYTTSSAERDTAVWQNGYQDEGIAGYVFAQSFPGTTPLYRLRSSDTDEHFYTTSEMERDAAIQNAGYVDEGIACYVYPAPVPGTAPFYRLLSHSVGEHFYTTSSVEREEAVRVHRYGEEGIACYIFPIRLRAGAVKPAGVTDLLVVRQTLQRYERGEIAHVENALKGEFKERTHRRTETTETLLLQETETTNEQEHDLQSTERFELKSEASKTIQEDMRAQAGFTVTGTYGAVTASANGQFGYDRSVQESTRTASSYARDVVERARSRVQERVLEQRSTRNVLEVEETAKHGFDNKEGEEHIVGIYRWIDKIYDAQIVNYGKRLMIEFFVPEPAAYYRLIEANHLLDGVRVKKPEIPTIQPAQIAWPGVQQTAATYEAVGIVPPPPEWVIVGTSLEVKFEDKDYEKNAAVGAQRVLPALGSTKVSGEISIPRGYVAKTAKWSGDKRAYVRKNPLLKKSSSFLEDPTSVSVGSGTWPDTNGDTAEVDGFSGVLPVAVITSAAGVIVTFRVSCQRTAEHLQDWQVKMYEAIMMGYQNQLQRYEDEVARVNAERGVQISGRPPLENRKVEQGELKRSAISVMTGQHFDDFGAIADAPPQDKSKSPKIVFEHASAEGDIVQFFEQAFEWHNMTYVFYPYFWGRKNQWPEIITSESTDPLFVQFLRAGYARVQVPVRLTYESMVLYYLATSKLWQEAEDAPVAKPYLPLVEEIRNQTGDDFAIGAGKIDVQKDAANITGNGTRFTQDDVDREIRIASKVYRIQSVLSATSILLATPYKGENAVGIPYSLGPKLVGPSWEIRLPTTLVMIDKPDINLNLLDD